MKKNIEYLKEQVKDYKPGNVAPRDRNKQLEDVLRKFLKDGFGCRFCDSGKLRTPNNPAKDHDDDCPYLIAENLLKDRL